MNEKKNNKKSWAHKVFVENLEIKIFAILLAVIVTVILNMN